MNLGCKMSLSFTYFSTSGWQISSYKDGTVFNNGTNGRFSYDNEAKIADKDFDKLIDNAYNYFIKEITKNA